MTAAPCLAAAAKALSTSSTRLLRQSGGAQVAEVSALPDPCPLPGTAKKRSLNERERLLYAPMADVGGLLYDKDAVYIDVPDWKARPCRHHAATRVPGIAHSSATASRLPCASPGLAVRCQSSTQPGVPYDFAAAPAIRAASQGELCHLHAWLSMQHGGAP